tara:strand:- start:68 stop:1408 length:1341 start_codon:yes stop_codon:yes gene_type:complete
MNNSIIDKILTEWAYRVPDGKPDPKNKYHLVKLDEAMTSMKLPNKFKQGLLNKLREIEFTNQSSFDDYNKKHKMRPTTKVTIGDKETTVGDATGEKESTDGSEYLNNLGIETPEGLSDEEIESIVQTEKSRRKFLSSTVGLMIENLEQTKTGAGARDMTREQWEALKSFAEGNGPDIKQYNVNNDDIDDAIQMIKESGVKKVMTFLQNKGAAGEGSTKKGTADNPGPGWNRDRKMLESFLKCGGMSAVTGKPLSIGTSNVDHRLSLDNGGKDEPSNWIWMETEINMNKSALTDKELIERSKKALSQTSDELKKKKLANVIKNETKSFATEHYKRMFERGGNGGITEDSLKKMTITDIKRMIYGWNSLYDKASGLNIQTYKQQVGGSRAGVTGKGGRGVPLSKGPLIQSAIEQFNKKQQVLTSEEIENMNKILYDGIEEIKTRERDI